MGLYTNLGALLMSSGQIDDCLEALNKAISLAYQYMQTDSYLVKFCAAGCRCLTCTPLALAQLCRENLPILCILLAC